jgi:hypothetical protein
MKVTTYSEARKTLAAVLDYAKTDGDVIIQRSDGSSYRLSFEKNRDSPFEGVKTNIRLPKNALKSVLSQLKETHAERVINH